MTAPAYVHQAFRKWKFGVRSIYPCILARTRGGLLERYDYLELASEEVLHIVCCPEAKAVYTAAIIFLLHGISPIWLSALAYLHSTSVDLSYPLQSVVIISIMFFICYNKMNNSMSEVQTCLFPSSPILILGISGERLFVLGINFTYAIHRPLAALEISLCVVKL